MATITFYHYTNKAGKDAIVRQKRIRASDGAKDAVFGRGVYGTTLSPSSGLKKIIYNNWDGRVDPTKGMLVRAAWAIKVELPKTDVKEAGSERDILIYTGGDLQLDDYVWEVIQVA
ncbi:uncharacterized protein LOC124125321 [Haliotis rufescens]|uniref:uncharacterized protein LOC124125321 n=1 Tax=Haliotis rufescens TaxID=6454 RepID=UPI00201FA26E|nr:uncharacterized protein LOC124125321 [Haliotis rufescens]